LSFGLSFGPPSARSDPQVPAADGEDLAKTVATRTINQNNAAGVEVRRKFFPNKGLHCESYATIRQAHQPQFLIMDHHTYFRDQVTPYLVRVRDYAWCPGNLGTVRVGTAATKVIAPRTTGSTSGRLAGNIIRRYVLALRVMPVSTATDI
jgi:hypothetical protein